MGEIDRKSKWVWWNLCSTEEIEDKASIGTSPSGAMKVGLSIGREQAIGALGRGNEKQVTGISEGISEAEE